MTYGDITEARRLARIHTLEPEAPTLDTVTRPEWMPDAVWAAWQASDREDGGDPFYPTGDAW